MKTEEIVIVNRLETGTAFAQTLSSPSEAVFVPGRVAAAVNAEIGDRFVALLVPNRVKADVTPWMAARIDVSLGLPTPPQPAQTTRLEELASVADRVRTTMRGGGVWTVGKIFDHLFPGEVRNNRLLEYNSVSNALRSMYTSGECAKFQLWRASDQERASREWFTCYPEKADVDEWAEEG